MGKLEAQRFTESLDHRVHVEFDRKIGPVSPWYLAPRIIETATGFVLIDLALPSWQAQVSWLRSGMLVLHLRHDAGCESCGLLLDTATKSYQLFDKNGFAVTNLEPG